MTEGEPRFAFGDNWREFAALVNDVRITESENALKRVFPDGALAGRRMLDIGCGSGLVMLAALRLGVDSVDGFDLDPRSTDTARQVLTRHYGNGRWSVREADILAPESLGCEEYDIVHSWGVLHHTGDMWRAITNACSLVAPGGLLGIAMYHRTPLCGFWAREKRFYSSAPGWAQRFVRAIFKVAFLAGLVVSGRNPFHYIANYQNARGMAWHHDVHDWLGGYPYESAHPQQVTTFLVNEGFRVERVYQRPTVAFGLFGSHCNEFVARRA